MFEGKLGLNLKKLYFNLKDHLDLENPNCSDLYLNLDFQTIESFLHDCLSTSLRYQSTKIQKQFAMVVFSIHLTLITTVLLISSIKWNAMIEIQKI